MKPSLNLARNLRGKIKDLKIDRDYWKNNYLAKKVELEKKEEVIKTIKELRNGLLNTIEVNFQGEINRLKEIIKWLIKPSTTEEKRPERAKFPHHFSEREYRP